MTQNEKLTQQRAILGAVYKYPNHSDELRLIEIKGFIYKFECGHWCTDTVFRDLYLIKLF
jgi:hypothetical protein